jgi:hypothetical protein
MRRLLITLAAVGLFGALALPVEANAAKRETGVSKGEITDVSSRRYHRRYDRHGYRSYYGRPYYYRPWGYPYYSYRPYWGPGPYWGGPGLTFSFGF